MNLKTLLYKDRIGWSQPQFPDLDSEQTLVLIFGAPEFRDDPTPIGEITAAYPQAHIIGCSTAGEIFDTEIHDMSLSVAVARFDKTALKTAVAPVIDSSESYQAGERLATELYATDLKAILVLSDGVHVNGSELVRGLNARLPASVIVTGGLAGDGDRLENTWILKENQLQTNYISAVGFYGDAIRIGHGSKGGWDIFGPERTITRSAGNILYELDGSPALQIYKEYLGERANELPLAALLFPLALRENTTDQKQVVRTILGIDEEAQSMIFAGDMPTGHLAQLMKANFDRLIDGASKAATMTQLRTPVSDEILSIAISCVGRRLVLGERTEEELEATLDVLPAGTQQIGFYSNGEISPYASGYCDLHNQTMTLTTIAEQL